MLPVLNARWRMIHSCHIYPKLGGTPKRGGPNGSGGGGNRATLGGGGGMVAGGGPPMLGGGWWWVPLPPHCIIVWGGGILNVGGRGSGACRGGARLGEENGGIEKAGERLGERSKYVGGGGGGTGKLDTVTVDPTVTAVDAIGCQSESLAVADLGTSDTSTCTEFTPAVAVCKWRDLSVTFAIDDWLAFEQLEKCADENVGRGGGTMKFPGIGGGPCGMLLKRGGGILPGKCPEYGKRKVGRTISLPGLRVNTTFGCWLKCWRMLVAGLCLAVCWWGRLLWFSNTSDRGGGGHDVSNSFSVVNGCIRYFCL